MYSIIQSGVRKLSRWTSSTGKATRILASVEDGSLRLLSPVTGSAVTIVYPVITHKVLTVSLYDSCANELYAYLNGSMLVYDCTSNPCRPLYQLTTPRDIHNSPVQCIALVKKVMNHEDLISSVALVFAGHQDGTLSLVEAARATMEQELKAHQGSVVLLTTSLPCSTESRPVIGGEEHLLSCGSDHYLCVWAVHNTSKVTLSLLAKVKLPRLPKAVCMIGSAVCVIFLNAGVVELYKLFCDGNADVCTRVQPLYHSTEENHLKEINDVAGCPALQIFVTSSMDCTLKVWCTDGQLLRELMFVAPTYGVCFVNERGDILVGFQGHIHSIGVADYLPADRLEQLVLRTFEDDIREDPVAFSNTCYNNTQGPVYPFNLTERRAIFEQNRFRKNRLEISEGKSTNKLKSILSKYQDVERDGQEFRHLHRFHINSFHELAVKWRKTAKKVITRFKRPQKSRGHDWSHTDPNAGPKDNRVPNPESQISSLHLEDVISGALANQKMGPNRRKSSVKLGKTKTLVSPRKKGSNKKLVDVVESVNTQQEEQESAAEEEEEQKRKEEQRQRDAEEQRKKYPVAPDGYVPNSVVRGLLNVHKPKQPSLQEKEKRWKLKPAPVGDPKYVDEVDVPESHFSENDITMYLSDTSMSNPAEHDDDGEIDSLSEEETSLAEKAASREPSLTSSRKSPVKEKRPISRSSPQRTAISRSPQRQKTISRQETIASTLISEEEESDIPVLIRKICSESWFPKKIAVSLPGIISAFTAIIDNVNNATHRQICDYIVQIKCELDYTSTQEDKVVEKLISQLASKNEVVRGNAVRALAVIGKDRQQVLVALLPILTDLSDDVRTEAQGALQRLGGVDNKDDLYSLMEKLNLVQQYSSKEDEDQALETLASTLLTRPLSNESELPSEASEKVEQWLEGAEGVKTDMTGLYDENDKTQDKTNGNTAGTNTKSKRPKGKPKAAVTPKSSVDPGSSYSSLPQNRLLETEEYGKAPSVVGSDTQKSRMLPNNPALYKMYDSQHDSQEGSTSSRQQSQEGSTGVHKDPGTSAIPGQQLQAGSAGPQTDLLGGSNTDLGADTGFPDSEGSRYSNGTYSKTLEQGAEGKNMTHLTALKENQESVDDEGFLDDGISSSHKTSKMGNNRGLRFEDMSVHKASLAQTEDDSGLGTTVLSEGTTSISRDKPGTVGGYSSTQHRAKTGLSPVLSSNVEEIIVEDDVTDAEEENWRQFFNRPSAQERRRLQEEKEAQEMLKKSRDPISLPPIRYLGDEVELVAGDPGLRLLHTVSVKPKSADYYGDDEKQTRRHKIDPVRGKLGATTITEDFGRSSYGILDLHWTTGIPSNPGRLYAARHGPANPLRQSLPPDKPAPLLKMRSATEFQRSTPLQDKKLPSLTREAPAFAWAEPLPPAPDRESRLADPKIRQEHKHYCDYYRLLKKRMHDHISKLMYIALYDCPR